MAYEARFVKYAPKNSPQNEWPSLRAFVILKTAKWTHDYTIIKCLYTNEEKDRQPSPRSTISEYNSEWSLFLLSFFIRIYAHEGNKMKFSANSSIRRTPLNGPERANVHNICVLYELSLLKWFHGERRNSQLLWICCSSLPCTVQLSQSNKETSARLNVLIHNNNSGVIQLQQQWCILLFVFKYVDEQKWIPLIKERNSTGSNLILWKGTFTKNPHWIFSPRIK